MKFAKEVAILKEHKMQYTTRDVLNNFWGTEFTFKTRKAAEKAIKLLGLSGSTSRLTGGYGFTLY
jgi:predicted SpoU family rRNA methylase